jgi:hypothetical protein
MDACQGLGRRRHDCADEPGVDLLSHETVLAAHRGAGRDRGRPDTLPRHARTTHGPSGTPGPQSPPNPSARRSERADQRRARGSRGGRDARPCCSRGPSQRRTPRRQEAPSVPLEAGPRRAWRVSLVGRAPRPRRLASRIERQRRTRRYIRPDKVVCTCGRPPRRRAAPAVAVPLNNIGAGARPSSPTSPWSSSASTPLPVRPGATWPVGSLRSWSTRPPNPKRNESPPRTVLGAILISPFSDPSLDAALGQLKASPSLHTPLLRLPRARRATPRGARTRAGHRRPAVPRQPRAVTARIKQADVRPPVAQVQSSMHHEDGRLPRSPVTRPSVPPARPSFMTLRLPESARSRRSRPTPH